MTPSPATVQPAEPFVPVKRRIADAVEAARDEILDLSHRIHAHPEPAFEERYAAEAVAELLREKSGAAAPIVAVAPVSTLPQASPADH